MKPPKEKLRLTLEDELPNVAGVYILAYLGRVVYVGKTEKMVAGRLRDHLLITAYDLGAWLLRVRDWANVRLDVLVPPDKLSDVWLKQAERACIKRFRPLFNELLVGEP